MVFRPCDRIGRSLYEDSRFEVLMKTKSSSSTSDLQRVSNLIKNNNQLNSTSSSNSNLNQKDEEANKLRMKEQEDSEQQIIAKEGEETRNTIVQNKMKSTSSSTSSGCKKVVKIEKHQ